MWRAAGIVGLALALPAGAVRAQPPAKAHLADFDAFCKDVQKNCRLLSVKRINWNKVRKQYAPKVAKAKDDAAFLQVMQEVVGKLKDGHAYLNPKGVKLPPPPEERFPGVVLAPASEKRVVVLEVWERATGDARKLARGWVVEAIDGKPARAHIEAAVDAAWDRGYVSSRRRASYTGYRLALRGAPDTTVTLTAAPPDGSAEPAAYTLTRDQSLAYGRVAVMPANIQRAGDVYWTTLPGGEGYVWLRRLWTRRNRFDDCFAKAWAAVAETPKLIVDLRGNGGGGIGEAFTKPFETSKRPLAVLIDAGTFSAGEGAASFFRERTAARMFGTATAGSSSKKTTFTAPSGLFEVYYSWRGQTNFGSQITEFHGIAPHQVVAFDPAQLFAGTDPYIAAAAAWLAKR